MKNLLEIDRKLKPRMEWLLAQIFHDFSWIWEAKLREKTIQNRVKKNIQSIYDFNIDKECIGSRFEWGAQRGGSRGSGFGGVLIDQIQLRVQAKSLGYQKDS